MGPTPSHLEALEEIEREGVSRLIEVLVAVVLVVPPSLPVVQTAYDYRAFRTIRSPRMRASH